MLVLSEGIGEVTFMRSGPPAPSTYPRHSPPRSLTTTPLTKLFQLAGTMCDLIEVECVKAECDLLAACRQSLAHGALLATRYILAEIDFNAGCKEGRAGQTELKVRIGFFQGSSPRDP